VYHVLVMPPVSAALGRLLLDRESLLKVLNRLYGQLTDHADRYRGRRDPDDQDLFDYPVYFCDGANWHTFRFSVNDTKAAGYLFVEAVSHRSGKIDV
jgi:hypothetical protein